MSKAAKPKKGMGSLRKLKEYNAWLKNEIRYYEMLVEKANNLIASKNNDLKTLNEMFQNQQGLLYVLIRRTGGTIVVTPNEWKVGIGQGVRVKADPKRKVFVFEITEENVKAPQNAAEPEGTQPEKQETE